MRKNGKVQTRWSNRQRVEVIGAGSYARRQTKNGMTYSSEAWQRAFGGGMKTVLQNGRLVRVPRETSS